MKKKTAAALISLSMLASMGTGAYAATKLEEIKAFLNPEIKVKVDGSPVQLRDVNGNAIAPIMYNEANYFPIRAISDALGVAVDYDQESKTIILGEKVEGISIVDGFNDTYHTKDPKHTTYMGKDYKEAFFDNGKSNRGSSFLLYPNKEYQTLYLQIAAVGEDLTGLEIEDAEENITLKEVEVLKVEDGLVTLEVDIGGVERLYIHSDAKAGGAVFVPLTTSYYK
ncbi:copper amine oxidase N-terminal domain-containing protein [Paenibacillus soyae]|uniref:Copper amine oxidase N-terminal domain-containing protein n=1 Tax=Paenibacillus soyae TaxID=2969249 RepID=A0A9X2MK42_9BACL|nr:copper amine oxidase N-terminal domain-containing protein [Paenibacillus soyae]MCR2803353.1 copper amine oxidase N-terminal domain-containing protein [Paenibacillus soyae]